MNRDEEIKSVTEQLEELRTKIENAQTVEEVRTLEGQGIKLKEQLTKLTTVENVTDFDKKEARGMNNMAGLEYREELKSNLLASLENRADAVGKTTDVTIPVEIMTGYDKTLKTIGSILAETTPMNVKAGVKIPVYAEADDASWVAEGAGSDTVKPDVTYITFTQHKIRKEVALTKELAEMTGAELENVVRNQVMKGIDRAQEKAIFAGVAGNGQFAGIKTTTGINNVTLTAVSYEGLASIVAALPGQYEDNAKFFMTKEMFYKYYGLVDTNGQPVGRVNWGLDKGAVNTLLGYPVVFTDGLGTGTDVYFGDMSKYIVNTIYEIRLSARENWENENQEIKGVACKDGQLAIPEAFVLAAHDLD